MQNYINALTAYLKKCPIRLNEEYKWPRSKSKRKPFDETFANRCDLSARFLTNQRPRGEVALDIVRKWGGIRGGADEAIVEMAADSPDKLIERGFDRVASWSKIITLYGPEKYLIYDARVAFSLNCVLWLSGVSDDFFPMPASQNRKIKKALETLATEGVRFGRSRTVRGRNFYCQYLELVHAVSARLTETPPWQVEMALFARGPVLAEELVATRQSGKG